MNMSLLNAPGMLFLGSDAATALAQGPRHFRSARNAVRFAMEQAAPVSLHGARLDIGGEQFTAEQIRLLHNDLSKAGSEPIQ